MCRNSVHQSTSSWWVVRKFLNSLRMVVFMSQSTVIRIVKLLLSASCTVPPIAIALSVCGTAPRGSLGLIGELLPADGGFHHHPPDGLHHHRHTINKIGVRGGSRLQHHRRGAR